MDIGLPIPRTLWIAVAALAVAVSVPGCYLLHSKSLSPPPDTVEEAVNRYRYTKEPTLPFYIFYFPRETTTATGYRIATSGFLKAITPPKPILSTP